MSSSSDVLSTPNTVMARIGTWHGCVSAVPVSPARSVSQERQKLCLTTCVSHLIATPALTHIITASLMCQQSQSPLHSSSEAEAMLDHMQLTSHHHTSSHTYHHCESHVSAVPVSPALF